MKILLVDDEAPIRETLEMVLLGKGYAVVTAEDGPAAISAFEREQPDVVILDVCLPQMSGIEVLRKLKRKRDEITVIMITAYHDMETTIQAMKEGAYEYIRKPIDVDELEIVIDKVAKNLKIVNHLEALITDISREYKADNIVGKSRAMQQVFKTIAMVSESRTTVLIQGESGTGKELIAKAIHYNSPFRKEPFVPVNCSSLVETLLESELFGHERGAFTGAAFRKMGKIEQAGNGTLLLDEVGDIASAIQVKLLRFLQEKEFDRVGGNERIKSAARIIAATNRDLFRLVEENHFREDLYFRLKVVEIHVPPLRERKEDIPLLVDHLLHKINIELHKKVTQIPKDVMDALIEYTWPGNVRELENFLTRAVVLSKGNVLSPDHIQGVLVSRSAFPRPAEIKPLWQVEMEHVRRALTETGWNKGQACELLGISRPTLREKIKKYKLYPYV
jgi:two-component system, NtrC family, response regulator AtoC